MYKTGKQLLTKYARNKHEVLAKNMYISRFGYMETFVVNETSEDVWFDNMMVMSISPAVVQETHYDPWGLELTGLGYQYGGIKANKYLYQGKEMMDDLNLGIYDFHARGYDPVIGRTWQKDPMADSYYPWSPYAWVMNNPLRYMDPTGMFSTHTDEDGNVVAVYDDGDLGVYRHEGQATKEDIDARHNIDNPSAGGKRMGRSIHTFSFANFEALERGEIIAEDRIDYGSTWAEDKIQSSLDEMSGYFSDYIWKANGNQKYDIKRKSPTGNVYYGSQVEEGVYASARDAGNILACAAAKKFNVPFEVAMSGYGALNLGGNNRVKGAAILSLHYLSKQGASSGYLWSKPFFGENPASGVMQYYGYFKGGKK